MNCGFARKLNTPTLLPNPLDRREFRFHGAFFPLELESLKLEAQGPASLET